MPRFACLFLVALLPGCATITTGTSQSISVLTAPPGAVCELKRRDTIVGVVNPTPGSVTVGKSGSDIGVSCTRADHLPAAATVRSRFQPATLGNILLGGVVGLVVDASTGASGRYPDSVSLILVATSPATEVDPALAARIADIRNSFAERIAAVRRDCLPVRGNATTPACAARIDGLERERDDALRALTGQDGGALRS